MMQEEKIDDHHVFPQAFLSESKASVSASQRDCVLNRTLIDKMTNIRIRKKAPSVYLQEIQQSVGDKSLSEILRSHLLPSSSDSSLACDDFERYLQERQELIAAQIKCATT